MKTQSASEIARVLHDEIFCRYGASKTIVTDRGRNFLSKLVNAICEIYQVARHKTASYNPQANGCVERQNATIGKTISKYIAKDQSNWHRVLPVVLMGMRSHPNTETSGFSPFKMMFGGEMRLPFDVNLIPKDILRPTDKIFINDLLDTLKLVHGSAKTNSELTQTESKEKHDLKAKQSDFKLGELVLRKVHKHTPGLSSKLEPKWDGPYYIVAKGPSDTYKLIHCSTHKESKSFDTARNLKRSYDPEVYRHMFSNYQTENINEEIIENEETAEQIEQPNQNHGWETKSKNATATPQPGEQGLNSSQNDENETAQNDQNVNHDVDNDLRRTEEKWFPVNKILKQRFRDGHKEYLLEWSDIQYKPSWQNETDVSPELKRQFYMSHTKAGKRRKRKNKYKYFNKN